MHCPSWVRRCSSRQDLPPQFKTRRVNVCLTNTPCLYCENIDKEKSLCRWDNFYLWMFRVTKSSAWVNPGIIAKLRVGIFSFKQLWCVSFQRAVSTFNCIPQWRASRFLFGLIWELSGLFPHEIPSSSRSAQFRAVGKGNNEVSGQKAVAGFRGRQCYYHS